MRVLHVDTARGWRGGQSQLALLLGHPGIEAALLCRDDSALPCATRSPLSLRGLHQAMRRFRPDLVAAHDARAHLLALAQRRAPVVVHRRLDFPIRRRARPKYALADGFIAVSDAVRAVLVQAGVAPERVRVVYDGVLAPSIRARAPLPPRGDRPVALAVGALVAHKDHATLIRAAQLAGFELWIAGEGPLRQALEAQAAGMPVRLLGQRPDVGALLAAADVFCHPSAEEGLGQAVLEARAVGCRIVATRAGGIPEAAGGEALLVAPRDPDALAAALRLSLHAPRPSASLPERFRAEAMRRATLDAYRQVRARWEAA